MCVCDIADKDEHVNAPNIEILGHGDDEAVHYDRGDDGSVAAGEKDHHVGDEGVLHRTLNDSAHRADTFHSTVSATKEGSSGKGRSTKEKNTDRSSAETGQAWCVTDVVEKRSPEKACQGWVRQILNQQADKQNIR